MSFNPTKPTARTFKLFTAPCVADPAWIVPLTEIHDDGNAVMYSTLEPIKALVAKIEYDRAMIDGRNEAYTEICQMFGVKHYGELRDLAKKVLDKSGNNLYYQ